MVRFVLATLFAVCFSASLSLTALAQEEQEKSALIEFVEGQLSAPDRQIRLNGLQGSLSSNVSFDSITIADETGIWLEIEKPQLIWNRTALFRGRLEVEELSATRIDYKRQPIADESLPKPEASGLALPDLPVAVILKKLNIPEVAFGPTVFGLETEASVEGRMVLDAGSLDVDLDIQRLDGSGGSLSAVVGYVADNQNLTLDIGLQEPENGIVATLLGIDQRPPVALRVNGDAPLENLQVSLAFDVDTQRILDGELIVRGTPQGLRANAKLGGPLAQILSPQSRAFFGSRSDLTFGALFADDGGVVIDVADIDSGNVQLRASAAMLADGFPSALNVDLQLEPTEASRVALPTEQGEFSIAGASLLVNYNGELRENWNASLNVTDIQSEQLALSSVSLNTDGSVLNLSNPDARQVGFKFDGSARDVSSPDAALARAIGELLTTSGAGIWSAGTPLRVSDLLLKGDTFSVQLDGAVTDASFRGDIDLKADNLAVFSSLAGRNLGGGAGLMAQGTLGFFDGQFDLTVEGAAQSLQIDEPIADSLLLGTTSIFGGVARTTDGLGFRNLNLTNDQLELTLNGRFASDFADLRGDALIRNLASISNNGSGALNARFGLIGEQPPFNLTAAVDLPQGQLAGKTARNISLLFDGRTDGQSVAGQITGDGFIGPERISLNGLINVDEGSQKIDDLSINVGGTDITGNFSRATNQLIDANFEINGNDISSIAALGLVEASGSVVGTVRLIPSEAGGQSGVVDLTAKNVVFADNRFGDARLDANLSDLLRKPRIDALLNARSVVIGGFDIRSIDARAVTSDATTDFELEAAFNDNDAQLSTTGQIVQSAFVSQIELSTMTLVSNVATARLDGPAQLRIENGTAQISDALLRVGSGSIRLTGSAGETINANIGIDALPLDIANAIRPDLGLRGVVNGEVAITGKTSDPRAVFRIAGSGLSAAQLQAVNISPLDFSTDGSFANQTIDLTSAILRNGQGVNLSATGQVPLTDGRMRVEVQGTAPLSLADMLLQDRGARATGSAQVNASVAGTLDNPVVSGRVSVNGGTFSDPLSNARLNNIGLDASLSGQQVLIDSFRANLAAGGAISASGSLGLSSELPANLSVAVNQARYSDGQTFSTVLNGNLDLTGNLAQSPLLSGSIQLGETEITVPESFAASAELLDVRHVLPPRAVRETLNRLARASPAPTPTSRPSVIRLNVTVDAPNRIFVRGRGLDAELGGRVVLTGPVVDIEPVGRFELIRGRLSIVGKRIDLDEGLITLEGDLNPIIDFLARVEGNDIDAFIRISGRLDDLRVVLSSSPELPEDEVLSQIIFGRTIDELSPLQVAKLASIALELTGGNSPSLIDSLRSGTGLDDLDLTDDGSGNPAVRAGKYINDNVYLNLQVGQSTEATINLDITDSLTAKGSVSSEGDTSIGVFFEKDY